MRVCTCDGNINNCYNHAGLDHSTAYTGGGGGGGGGGETGTCMGCF